MNQVRRIASFFALLVIIILSALAARAYLPDIFYPLKATPTATPPPPVVTIRSIRGVAELATVEYRAVAEVPHELVPDDVRKYFGVKEQILLLVYGDVKAGFDLSKLTEEDLWTDGTRLLLHLPAPEILYTSIDFERTHVVYYHKSLLVAPYPYLQGDALQIAKDEIQQTAIEVGILEEAIQYGQLFFENHLRSLGFTKVRVVVS